MKKPPNKRALEIVDRLKKLDFSKASVKRMHDKAVGDAKLLEQAEQSNVELSKSGNAELAALVNISDLHGQSDVLLDAEALESSSTLAIGKSNDKATTPSAQDISFGLKSSLVPREDIAELEAELKAKLKQSKSGFNPALLQAGITLAGFYIDSGTRSFSTYTNAMVDALGDAVRPHLRSWYEAIRYLPQLTVEQKTGMTSPYDIDNGNIDHELTEGQQDAESGIEIESAMKRYFVPSMKGEPNYSLLRFLSVPYPWRGQEREMSYREALTQYEASLQLEIAGFLEELGQEDKQRYLEDFPNATMMTDRAFDQAAIVLSELELMGKLEDRGIVVTVEIQSYHKQQILELQMEEVFQDAINHVIYPNW